jgi:hypothetical protein
MRVRDRSDGNSSSSRRNREPCVFAAARHPNAACGTGCSGLRRVAVYVLLILLGGYHAAAQDAQPTPGSAPLLYRKIFVPEEAVRSQEAVSTRDEAYYPVEREEFERLLSEARVKHLAPEMALDARITRGVYHARLDEPLVMTGTAQLSIAHLGTEPVLLTLEPLSLAISQPVWAAEPAEQASEEAGAEPPQPRPAQIGLDPSGRVTILVDRSGELQFDWSLRGQDDVAGDVAFPFRLPSGTVNCLQLRLAKNLVPRASDAVVTPVGSEQETDATRQWQVQFGREFPVMLTVGASRVTRQPDSLVTLRQTSTYRFAARGTDLVTVLRLDVYQQPLDQLTLQLDNGLHLVSAVHGSTSLNWAESDIGSGTRIALELPAPISGTNQEIVLRAVADGQFDKLWRLPRIEAPDLLWLEGTTALEIPESLVLDQIQTTDCRQTGVGPLAAPQRGESVQLQDFKPRAAAEVVIRPRRSIPTVQTGTTLELGPGATNLVYIADIAGPDSGDFVLEIDGPADWRVDQVQMQPPSMLEDWKPIRRGNQQRTLQIRLRQPLAAVPSVRLVIRAHQDGLRPGETQTAADLRLGTFKQVETVRRLMLLAAKSPNQLEMTGDTALSRLSLEDLSETDHDLIRDLPGAVIFVDDQAADDLAVSLSSSPPSFSADIEIEADVRADQIARSFTIRCSPESSNVNRIQVQFTEALGEQPEWTWLDNPELVVDARRLEPGEAETGVQVQGETWSIALPSPQAKPFTLRVQGNELFDAEASLPLVSVLGASPQSGSVTIRTSDAVPFEIISQDLWPVPASLPRPDQFTTIRSVLRYEPSLEGRLLVRRTATQTNTLARVWTYRLNSQLYREGRAIHTACFLLENNGLKQVRIAIPPAAQLLGARVDGRILPLPRDASRRAALDVALPHEQRFPTVTVQYSTQIAHLRTVSDIAVPWLDIDLPVFRREWIPAAPPGFAVLTSESTDRDTDWQQRLFGPVLRAPDQARFDPSSARDWRALWIADPSGEVHQQGLAAAASPAAAVDGGPPAAFWNIDGGDARRPTADAGWSTRHITVPAAAVNSARPTTSVRVVRADFLTATGWAVFLLAAGVVGWTTRRRPLLGLPLVVLAGVVALYGGATATPLLASCFLGTLVSALWSLIRPFTQREQPPQDDAPSSQVSFVMLQTATSVAVLLAILWLSISLAAAQEPAASPPQDPPETIYRVLYPIDADQEPLGPYVYVPRQFLSELQRSANGTRNTSRPWVIDGAEYHVAFEWDVAAERLTVGELVADWHVTTYRNDARIRLPITQDQAYLLPDRAWLDGEAASVTWEPDESGLSVTIPRTGPAHLTLAFRPRVTSSGGTSGFAVSIPPLPTAEARLRVPRDATPVRCPTALGSWTLDPQVGERVVQLGATDRLVVQWADDPHFAAGPSGVEVEQLMSLQIRPGSVVLRARFQISCLGGEIREAQLRADPRLRMLPPKDTSPIADYHVHDGDPQQIHLTLRPPYGQQVAFEADFIVTGVSGVGVIRPPQLEMQADRTNRRWLGVSVDPSLQFEPLADLGESRVDLASFVAAWGSAEQPPELALSLPEAPPDLALAARPREPRLNAVQRLSLRCDAQQAAIRFEADIEPLEGLSFQYQVQVPANVHIQAISIEQDGDQLATQWTRRKADEIIVRTKRPITETHRLSLDAQMPVSLRTPTTLPHIQLANVEQGPYEVRLYRQAAVKLIDLAAAGWEPLSDGVVGDYVQGWGRLEAVLGRTLPADPSGSLQFKVVANRPRLRGTLLVFLRRVDDTWRAEALYELQIQAGVVDALRFEIPAAWKEPLETDFPARQEIIEIPDQDRRYLVLRPHQAIATTTRFRIWGEVASRPGEQVRAPDIIPLDIRNVDRYLVAPETIGQKEVIWVTDGLRAVQLPPQFADLVQPYEQTFLANQPRFQAIIEELRQQSGSAGIPLADFHVDLAGDGSLNGTATFDILPAGRKTCRLVLPDSCSLLQASIDNVPALLKQVETNQWQLQLGAPQLAQQIQILYRGQQAVTSAPDGTCPVPVPHLVGLPVQRSLWTVQAPDDVAADLSPAESAVDARVQEQARFDHYSALIESTAETLGDIDPAVARSWCLPWMRRVASSRSKLLRWAGQRTDPGPEQDQLQATVEARYGALLQRLSAGGLITISDLQAFQASRPAEVWSAALGRAQAGVGHLSVAGHPPVSIRVPPARAVDHRVRWTVIAVMVTCAGALSLVFPFPGFEEHRGVILTPALIAAALAWWAWCSPSFLGFLLAGVAICCWLVAWISRFRGRNSAFHLGTR